MSIDFKDVSESIETLLKNKEFEKTVRKNNEDHMYNASWIANQVIKLDAYELRSVIDGTLKESKKIKLFFEDNNWGYIQSLQDNYGSILDAESENELILINETLKESELPLINVPTYKNKE
jgi:hypothetical protein